MKRFLVMIVSSLLFLPIFGRDDFEVKTNFSIVSHYLYHGECYGGLSFQPEIAIGYYGVYGLVWFNIGASDYTFKSPANEVNFKAGFKNYGIKVEYKHVSMLDEPNCFDYTKSSAYGLLDLGYDFEYALDVPIRILYTLDVTHIQKVNTYIEFEVNEDLDYGISIYGAFGIKANRDIKILPANIEFKLTKTWKTKYMNYSIFGQAMGNPYELKMYGAGGIVFTPVIK